MKPLIALDADGVLLDYHAAYRTAWESAFGYAPALKDPLAYWPRDRWDVQTLDGDELTHFRSFFNEQFWSTIPALPGAIAACWKLVDAGYELICVSALDAQFAQARQSNLRALDFPIKRLIATSSVESTVSPKARVINDLAPMVFVDDYLPYHRGIEAHIHRALVLREPNGSPNVGSQLVLVDSQHADLAHFTHWWLL